MRLVHRRNGRIPNIINSSFDANLHRGDGISSFSYDAGSPQYAFWTQMDKVYLGRRPRRMVTEHLNRRFVNLTDDVMVGDVCRIPEYVFTTDDYYDDVMEDGMLSRMLTTKWERRKRTEYETTLIFDIGTINLRFK